MSLAAIKRRIQVGTMLQVVRHDWPTLRVNGESDAVHEAKRAAFFAVRIVTVVKAGEIGLKTGNGDLSRTSWLSWPKASCVRETANGFQVDLRGDGQFTELMEYEWR